MFKWNIHKVSLTVCMNIHFMNIASLYVLLDSNHIRNIESDFYYFHANLPLIDSLEKR